MDPVETKPRTSERVRRRLKRRRRSSDRWNATCEALLGTVVVGSALAIGTVHMQALLVVAALALVGATLEVLKQPRVPRPALALAALSVWSALQSIPLPAGWVAHLSPVTSEVWQRCLIPFGEPALRHFSLSLDPGASVAEALKWLTYACVYVMAARMRARRGSTWLALLLFGSATLATLITLAHGALNLPVLYGVYHPSFAVARFSVGPLLNSNNLAGYALLGLFAGVGLVQSGRSPIPRLPLLIGLGVIATALCMSGSRAGVACAVAFGVVTLAWLGSRGSRLAWTKLALGAAPFAVAVALAVALDAGELGQLASLDMRRKASAWLWSLPMIREHAVFGVGRGAFESAFPPYRQALDYDWSIVVTHAENFVVQWVAEWGIPVGACAVVLLVTYVLRQWYGSRSDRQRFMVMTGLVALLVQNLADMGLEVPALGIAAALALAAGESPATTLRNDSAKRVRYIAAAAIVPAVAIWAAAVVWSRFPVESERGNLAIAYRELAVKSPVQRAHFREQLRQAMLRHPGEPYFPLLGALVAMRGADGNALPWLARSLDLGPTNGPVHLVLAQLLREHGATNQAMLHLRLAAQYDRTLLGSVAVRAPLWAPVLDQLMQAIPDGPYGDGMLLDACARERWPDVKIECFRRAVIRSPRSPRAQQQLAENILQAVRAGQAPCDAAHVERCATEAESALLVATKLEPKAWRTRYLMSKVLRARGDIAGAARLLTRVCPTSVEGEECWAAALEMAIESRSDEAVTLAANGFAGRPCNGSEACANTFSLLASHLESGGQFALANTFYTKAAETDPSAARWLKVGELAMRAHLYGVARAALERADRSPDASATTRADTEMLRQRIVRVADLPF